MLHDLTKSAAMFVAIGAVMTCAERLRPANAGQSFLRSEFATDVFYWFLPMLIYWPLAPRALAHFGAAVAPGFGFAFIAGQPIWAQAFESFVIADFFSYWAHRWLHGRTLWAFHAVHHGSPQVDWLSAVRNHPVNVLIERVVLTAPLLALGMSPLAIAALGPACAFYNFFTHANLKIDMGPLRYIFVSPILHRWHHTRAGEGCDKNFGEALAIWDVLFGTFYLPDRIPLETGLSEPPPPDPWGQTIYPLKYFFSPRRAIVPAE